MDNDKQAAYSTLYYVLVEYVKLLAPFIPFTAEVIYQNLVRSVDSAAPKSVHHCLYPESIIKEMSVEEGHEFNDLLQKMGLAITTASLGRAARSAADIKLRQPLAKARINVGSAREKGYLRELREILSEEINVKEIEIVMQVGELVNYKLMPNNRVLGPKFGQNFPKVRQALLALDPAAAARTLQAGEPLTLQVAGETVTLGNEDVLVQTESRGGTAVASDKGVTVAVDTELTPALVQEGFARDVVRQVNNMRKDAGLEISDRIELSYQGANGDVAAALTNFADFVQQETLTVHLQSGPMPDALYSQTVTIGDQDVTLQLRKA